MVNTTFPYVNRKAAQFICMYLHAHAHSLARLFLLCHKKQETILQAARLLTSYLGSLVLDSHSFC